MNMLMIRCTVVALLLQLVACAGLPVSTDYDVSRDFAALKTYAWLEPPKKLVVDPLVDNDLMAARVQHSVDAELAALGYRKVAGAESVDFLVSYHISAEDQISFSSFHSHFGYYPCWHGCYGPGFDHDDDLMVNHYKQGTFMLDVIDPASKKLMWRGIAGRRLVAGTPQERDDYVRSIVTAIVAKFPPR
jgi:hypothetical protein